MIQASVFEQWEEVFYRSKRVTGTSPETYWKIRNQVSFSLFFFLTTTNISSKGAPPTSSDGSTASLLCIQWEASYMTCLLPASSASTRLLVLTSCGFCSGSFLLHSLPSSLSVQAAGRAGSSFFCREE